MPQLARCGEEDVEALPTSVGLRRWLLLGDLRSAVGLVKTMFGVGEGVFNRRLGEERFASGVGEGGFGDVRLFSSVGVAGRGPEVRPAAGRSE